MKEAHIKGKNLRDADNNFKTSIDDAIEQGDFLKAQRLIDDADILITNRKFAIEYSERVKTTGKFRKAGNYHGDSSHGFTDVQVQNIIANPDNIYQTSNAMKLIYQKGGDIVLVDMTKSARGNVITAYGSSGVKGQSGASVLGGMPTDPGLAVTESMILKGEIPKPGGYFEPAIKIFP